MRYLALSTVAGVDACEYPDSGKVLVVTGKPGEPGLRKMFRAENTVEYYDREGLAGPADPGKTASRRRHRVRRSARSRDRARRVRG